MTRTRLGLACALAVAIGLAVAAAFGAFASGGKATAAGASAGVNAVHVHGHWTVVVRSTSGKVVARYHFHNDFVGPGSGAIGGAAALSEILSGGKAPGAWDLTIQGSACPASNGNFCQMFLPTATPSFFASPPDTKNLTVTVPTSGTDAFSIVLQGDVTATSDGNITRVGSGLQKCPPTATVGGDCGIGYNEITDRTLASPISGILSGQDISVTVKLSFS
jgi:hypothetical protein